MTSVSQPAILTGGADAELNTLANLITGALKYSHLKLTKREIARILTVQTERQATAAKTER